MEADRIEFTENPLLQRREAGGNAARLSTSSVASSATVAPPPPPVSVSASAHTAAIAQAAHSVSAKSNPLLASSPTASARARALESTIAEEEGADAPAGGLYDASTSGDYEGGDDERLRVNFTRFGDAVSRVFTDKVHFFQAREAGATAAANIDEVDMRALALDEPAAAEVEAVEVEAAEGGRRRRSVLELSLVFDKTKDGTQK